MKVSKIVPCIVVVMLVQSFLFSGEAEAHLPMQTEYAETLPKAGWELGLHAGYMDMSKSSGGSVTPMTEQMYELNIGYGVTGDLSLYLRPSYKVKEMEMVHGGRLMKEESSGIGDTSMLARYRFLRRAEESLAFLIGTKLPTGASDVKDNGRRLMDMVQPGTGSFDYVGGVAMTLRKGGLTFDGDVIYRLNTENSEDYKFGNLLSLDIAGLYRIKDFYIMAELNGRVADKDELGGIPDGDTGGRQIFFTPGLSYHLMPELMLMLSVQLPVYQELNGEALETNYHLMGGAHWFF